MKALLAVAGSLVFLLIGLPLLILVGTSAAACQQPGTVGAVGLPWAGGTINTPADFAAALLPALGAPVTAANVSSIVAWEQIEGGNWHNSAAFNPLNTTQPEPGYSQTGTQGNIGVYLDWAQGIKATVDTLTNGLYNDILAALQAGIGLATQSYASLLKWSGGAYDHIGTPGDGPGTPAPAQLVSCVATAGVGPALVSQGALAAAWPTILAFLQAQLGKPYAWGAIGPDSYDCSGLVMMAFRAAGINLPRTSELQYAATVSGTIPLDQAQPGDLLFSEGNPPGHVRVYIGNGLAIAAPFTGAVVRVEPVGDPGLLTAVTVP